MPYRDRRGACGMPLAEHPFSLILYSYGRPGSAVCPNTYTATVDQSVLRVPVWHDMCLPRLSGLHHCCEAWLGCMLSSRTHELMTHKRVRKSIATENAFYSRYQDGPTEPEQCRLNSTDVLGWSDGKANTDTDNNEISR